MLAGMLLHMVQPGLPVQHRFDLLPNRQRPLTIMHYFAAALRSISHLHAAQRSAVTQLTAALRKNTVLSRTTAYPRLSSAQLSTVARQLFSIESCSYNFSVILKTPRQ